MTFVQDHVYRSVQVCLIFSLILSAQCECRTQEVVRALRICPSAVCTGSVKYSEAAHTPSDEYFGSVLSQPLALMLLTVFR